MMKAGKILNVFYPKMINLSCLAHAFQRILETILPKFPKFDDLVSIVKKTFFKAPSRV